jgi:hypothetical protein
MRQKNVFYLMALLKLNVDLNPMVIGANTRDSCLEKRVNAASAAEEAHVPPAKKRAPGAEINRQD